MNSERGDLKREYVGFIRIGGQPEIQLRVMASSSSEAREIVIEQYGVGHVISIWNEEDARHPR